MNIDINNLPSDIVVNNVKTVDDLDAESSNNLCYDIESGKKCVPNTDEILKNIKTVLLFIDKNEDIVQLKKNNYEKYENLMEKLFPDFSDKYYATFKKVISGEDLTILYKMLKQLALVEEGNKSFDKAETSVGTHLAKEYILPITNKNKSGAIDEK